MRLHPKGPIQWALLWAVYSQMSHCHKTHPTLGVSCYHRHWKGCHGKNGHGCTEGSPASLPLTSDAAILSRKEGLSQLVPNPQAKPCGLIQRPQFQHWLKSLHRSEQTYCPAPLPQGKGTKVPFPCGASRGCRGMRQQSLAYHCVPGQKSSSGLGPKYPMKFLPFIPSTFIDNIKQK